MCVYLFANAHVKGALTLLLSRSVVIYFQDLGSVWVSWVSDVWDAAGCHFVGMVSDLQDLLKI